MAVRVRVRVQRHYGGVIAPPSGPQATVQATQISQANGGAQRFDQLKDVVEGVPVTGQVVTYDVTGDRYVVTDLDAGTF